MGYIEQSLLTGERVVYRARLHWIVLMRAVLLGSILATAGIGALVASAVTFRASASQAPTAPAPTAHAPATPAAPETRAAAPLATAWLWLGIILVLVAAGVVLAGIVRRNATEIAVTNRRVLIKTGIVRRHTTEVLISKIESIGVDESLLGRMLGFGTVMVRGTGGTPEGFPQIARPLEFRRQVQSQTEAALPPARDDALPPGRDRV